MSKNYQSALVCSKGCVRGNNEDNFYFLGDRMQLREMDAGAHIVYSGSKEKQAYAIFDGMGGEENGEQAASIAAETFAEMEDNFFGQEAKNEVNSFARKASAKILDYARKHQSTGQGTTFAGLIIFGQQALVANVGDSRVYLLRDQHLELVTKDHSYVYELYLSGKLTEEQARKHPKNNVITHFLGTSEEKIGSDFVFIDQFKLYHQDRFMLCSDGVSDLLSNRQIEELLVNNKKPDDAATALVQTALELSGKDNTTCIVVDIFNPKLKSGKSKKTSNSR